MERTDNWEKDFKIIIDIYTDCINRQRIEVYKILKNNINNLEEIRPLIDFIMSRLDAVYSLILDWMLWDAEIVLRSALETLVKLIYILEGNSEEYLERCNEFWRVLPKLYSLKLSMQGKRNLEYLGESEIHRLAYTPLILPPAEEKQIKDKWPKSDRQKIEQRWSFSEIVLFLSRKYKGTSYEGILTLTHTYRIASHVIHGDETGILIIHERDTRPNNECIVANRAHFLRFVSDLYLYSFAIANFMVKYLDKGTELDNSKTILKDTKKLKNIIESYQKELFEDKVYDRFR